MITIRANFLYLRNGKAAVWAGYRLFIPKWSATGNARALSDWIGGLTKIANDASQAF
jgi:hypothetical protein